jgi:orotate phosphoribosyltransferase
MIPQAWDIELREGALRLARCLLATGAIRFDPEHPFRLGTGLVSPVHVEGRRLLSYPAVRDEVLRLALRMIDQEISDAYTDEPPGRQRLDAIAAAEGAGVPFATLIADRMGLPLVFVRKEVPEDCPYKHRIEGAVEPGWRVLLVEQLATDGHRKVRFCEPLRQAGCEVRDVFVLFQYGIFDQIHEHLSPLGITLHALATWWDLLEVANTGHYLDEHVLGEIQAYLHDPRRWTEAHGKGRKVA